MLIKTLDRLRNCVAPVCETTANGEREQNIKGEDPQIYDTVEIYRNKN